jgi:hypothetical protein
MPRKLETFPCRHVLLQTSNKLRNDDDDNSMPKLVGRKCHESDSDAEFDDDGDSIPGFIRRHHLDSDSDDESKNKNWESEDEDSDDATTLL